MEMAAQLYLRNKLRRIGLLLACLAASACAAPPPSLPVDTTATNRQKSLSADDFSSRDLAMNCKAISAEKKSNAEQIETANKAIEGNRAQNQTAGMIGGLFPIAYVGTEGNYAEKNKIATLGQRQDVLIKLATLKKCP